MACLFTALPVRADEPLPMDEDAFLKQPVDFSPPTEAHLDQQWLEPPSEPYPFPQAEVGQVNGVPRFLVEGEPLSHWSRSVGATTLPGAPVERQLWEQGVRLFVIDVKVTETLDEAPRHAMEQFRERAANILAAAPDARLMVRLWYQNVAEDFVKAHPDALLQGADGTADWGRGYHSTHPYRPNFLNEWRRYVGEHIYKFVHAVGQSAYAPHVVGFYIGAMNSGEWWYYKGAGDPGWDYSPTRQAAFERFARIKYQGVMDMLPELWGRPMDDLFYRLPSLEERRQRPIRPLSPESDYLQVLNIPVTNAAQYFARIIKTATSGRSLVGIETHAGLNTMNNNGTVFLTHLLDSPDIDFLGGPPSYGGREPGNTPYHRAALASLTRHNMIWFSEGDFRTHQAYGTRSGAAGHPPIDPRMTREVFKREFARSAIRHYHTYLMDFGWKWFYDRDVIETVGMLNRTMSFMLEAGLQRNAAIAVVTDQESQLYGNYFSNPTYMAQYVLDKIGADHDFYELRDFLAGDTYKPYRLVIFLNLRALSDAERQSIEQLKSDQRVILWMHDPGVTHLSRRHVNSDEALHQLTGIRLQSGHSASSAIHLQRSNYIGVFGSMPSWEKLYEGPNSDVIQAEPMRQVSISDAAAGQRIGNVIAAIRSTDAAAIPLGVDDAGHPYFVLRDFPEWTSVYTATCLLRPEIIRDLARHAGVHTYVDTNDPFFAGENFIAIHAASDGARHLRLPRRSDVFDVFERKVLARKTDELSLDMSWGETRLLYLGDADAARDRLAAIDRLEAQRNAEAAAGAAVPSVSPTFYRHHQPAAPEGEGPFGLTDLTPGALLYAGPFPADEEALRQLDGWAASADGSSIHADVADLAPITDFTSQQADQYLAVTQPRPMRSLNDGIGPWYPIRGGAAWMDDYVLGMASNQAYLGCFFLRGKPGTEIEVAFHARGDSRIWLNGELLDGAPGSVGTLVTLPREDNLVMFRVASEGEHTGFTVKLLKPDPSRKRGQQARDGAEGIEIWLKPIEDR